MSDAHNVFISHRHEDDALVSGFKNLMKNRGVTIRDASITSDDPNRAHNIDYIKNEILAPGIKWAGTLVVIITPDTKNHDWVSWEIEYAIKHNKRIIGVWASGSAGCEVPEPLEKYGDAIVGWNAKQVLSALSGARIFHGSDGQPRPRQPINRIDC